MRIEFCKGCGQKITIGWSPTSLFAATPKPIEFEDGWYCAKCAKERVEKKRKKI